MNLPTPAVPSIQLWAPTSHTGQFLHLETPLFPLDWSLIPHVIKYLNGDILLILFKLLHLHWSTSTYPPSVYAYLTLPYVMALRPEMFRKGRGRGRSLDNDLNKGQHFYLDLRCPPYTRQYLTSNVILDFSFLLALKYLFLEHTKHKLASHLCSCYFLYLEHTSLKCSFSPTITSPRPSPPPSAYPDLIELLYLLLQYTMLFHVTL